MVGLLAGAAFGGDGLVCFCPVRVTCQPGGPLDGLVYLDAEFDKDGVMRRVKPATAPGRALGRPYEEMARSIALVVFETL